MKKVTNITVDKNGTVGSHKLKSTFTLTFDKPLHFNGVEYKKAYSELMEILEKGGYGK